MRLVRAAILLGASFAVACGARTELGNTEEFDSSMSDAPEQDANEDDGSPQEAGFDASPDVLDASTDAEPDAEPDADAEPPPECATDCTSNHECKQTCPPLQSGRYCCDLPTGVCYAFNGLHCPPAIQDAGFD